MNFTPCTVVAEIGATHIGQIDRAKNLISLAKLAGVEYVKFQKRNPIESVPERLQNQPHPNKTFAYGDTYLEHRMALELDIDQHAELKKYCDSIQVGYSTSVWDITSAREVISIEPDFIKVPSACNSNFDLLTVLSDEFAGDIHISLGMINYEEKQKIYGFCEAKGIQNRVILYHCTSEYPCPFERLYLGEILKLSEVDVKAVGFSNHGFGIAADIVAYVLGSKWIERHFIDDRTFRHTDAVASLEPDGLRRLCRDLKSVHKTLAFKEEISDLELEQREKLRGEG